MFSNKIKFSLTFTVFQRPEIKKKDGGATETLWNDDNITPNAFFSFNVITFDNTQEIFYVCSTDAEYAEYMFKKHMFAIKTEHHMLNIIVMHEFFYWKTYWGKLRYSDVKEKHIFTVLCYFRFSLHVSLMNYNIYHEIYWFWKLYWY